MDKKFNELTISDAFILSKVMENYKVARRLMELLTGEKIVRIVYPKKNIICRKDGRKGICMELHRDDAQRSVQNIQLFFCEEDIFCGGYPIYRFEERCVQLPDIILKEGVVLLFVCVTKEPDKEDKNAGVSALAHYIKDSGDKRNNFIKMLDDEVRRVKSNPVYKKEYEALIRDETEQSQKAYARAVKKRNKNHIPIM